MSAYNRLYPRHVEAVTPANGVAVSFLCLYIGGAGDVAVIPQGSDDSVVFTAMPEGSFLPVQVREVLSAGTTATLILGLRANGPNDSGL